MLDKLRLMLIGAICGFLVLLLTPGLTHAAPPQPSPSALPATVVPPEPSPGVHAKINVTGFWLTSNQWTKAKYAAKARNKAISPSGKTMDYRKMKTAFGKHYIWRRTMAAGYKQAGGKIQHISKAEAKKVEAMRKKIYGKHKPLHTSASTGGVAAYDSPCKGRSGNVVVNRNYSYKYLNSCQTIDLQYALAGCVGAMGAVAKFASKDPRIDVPAYFIAAGCALAAADINRQASKSDVGAVYLRTYKQEAYQPYNGGTQYFIRYSLLPQ